MRSIRSIVVFSACVAFAFAISGCKNSPTSPSTVVPFSQVDLRVGTGTTAASGNTVTVNYTGWLYSATQPDQKGLIFDTSVGASPFSFTLGAGQVIVGWDQGLAGMNVGGLRRLVIPPTMAYGSSRVHAIPPNATLVFEVELVDVK